MPKFMPKGLAELHRWTRADNIMDAYIATQKVNSFGSSAPVDGPPQGDGIGMGADGVNAEVIELKKEYMEEYGRLTTDEANDVFKNIFHRNLFKRIAELAPYNDAQLDFALDVAANALIVDFDKYMGFNPKRAIRAALDLWDTPDADDLRDEIEDGFDDLHWSSRGVVHRYNHLAMGHGGIFEYLKSLK